MDAETIEQFPADPDLPVIALLRDIAVGADGHIYVVGVRGDRGVVLDIAPDGEVDELTGWGSPTCNSRFVTALAANQATGELAISAEGENCASVVVRNGEIQRGTCGIAVERFASAGPP
ncbi:MAG: hypothetical protein ACRD29_14585 [Acidimicrobiales bacterium]